MFKKNLDIIRNVAYVCKLVFIRKNNVNLGSLKFSSTLFFEVLFLTTANEIVARCYSCNLSMCLIMQYIIIFKSTFQLQIIKIKKNSFLFFYEYLNKSIICFLYKNKKQFKKEVQLQKQK